MSMVKDPTWMKDVLAEMEKEFMRDARQAKQVRQAAAKQVEDALRPPQHDAGVRFATIVVQFALRHKDGKIFAHLAEGFRPLYVPVVFTNTTTAPDLSDSVMPVGGLWNQDRIELKGIRGCLGQVPAPDKTEDYSLVWRATKARMVPGRSDPPPEFFGAGGWIVVDHYDFGVPRGVMCVYTDVLGLPKTKTTVDATAPRIRFLPATPGRVTFPSASTAGDHNIWVTDTGTWVAEIDHSTGKTTWRPGDWHTKGTTKA